jgi:hypothetical protein
MSSNSFFAKSLRFIGIVLMALTGGFTLLGGLGTTCAALFPTNWESMTLCTYRNCHWHLGNLGNGQTCERHA